MKHPLKGIYRFNGQENGPVTILSDIHPPSHKKGSSTKKPEVMRMTNDHTFNDTWLDQAHGPGTISPGVHRSSPKEEVMSSKESEEVRPPDWPDIWSINSIVSQQANGPGTIASDPKAEGPSPNEPEVGASWFLNSQRLGYISEKLKVKVAFYIARRMDRQKAPKSRRLHQRKKL